jgi:serine/threonine-protein kinase
LPWPQFVGRCLAVNLFGLLKVLFTLVVIMAAVGAAFLYAVSRSPEQVLVPDVVGRPAAEAQRILADRGLTSVKGEGIYSAQYPAGRVARTRPYPQKIVKRGREVELMVSLGPRQYAVPDAVKLPLKAAQERLQRAGFKVGKTTEEYSSTIEKGQVVRQDPAARTESAPDVPVGLAISKGRRPRERGERASEELRYSLVTVRIPQGEQSQRLRLLVQEGQDSLRTVYDRMHRPGETVEVRVSGKDDYTIRVYLDHRVIREEKCQW